MVTLQSWGKLNAAITITLLAHVMAQCAQRQQRPELPESRQAADDGQQVSVCDVEIKRPATRAGRADTTALRKSVKQKSHPCFRDTKGGVCM